MIVPATALLAFLAQASVQVPPTITAVEVHLPAGADPHLLDRVEQLVLVRKGQTLSRRSVSRSIESLFATGKFADIEVLGTQGEDGVSLTFNLVPRQNVGVVYTEGQKELTQAEVIAATGLETGTEYWPERVQQASMNVAALYHRRGFRSATVRTEASTVEGAVSISFIVEEGAASVVRSVVFSGAPGLPQSELLEAFGMHTSDVLDLNRLELGLESLRTLYRKRHFYRAKVDPAVVGDDGRIEIPVASGPEYELVFSGNTIVSDQGLKALLAYSGEEALDSLLIQRMATRIERFFRFRGYHEVRVVGSEVLRPGNQAALGFSIEEGQPLRVTSIAFDGARVVGPEALRQVLVQVMEAGAPAVPFLLHPAGEPTTIAGHQSPVFAQSLPEPPLETVLDEPTWVEAADAMSALYRERGYLRATVRFGGAEIRGAQAQVRFLVEEGPLATLSRVEAIGLPPKFESSALGAVKLDVPISPSEVRRLEEDVTRELGRKGYLFATVSSSFVVDDTGHHAVATVQVVSGPQVKVRAVLPVGQVRTAEEVIVGQATMKEGLPLDSEALFSTQANLSGLGIFRNVAVEMLSPERPEPLKTVILRVRERPLFTAEGFLGYFFADGIRGGVEGSIVNIGGRGVTLTGRAQGNLFFTSEPALSGRVDLESLALYQRMGGRLNLTLDARSLLPAGLGLRFDIIAERVFRPQFRFSRVAGIPTLDWSHTFEFSRIPWLRPKLSLALQYEAEWSYVESVGSALTSLPPISLVDQERLRFLFGEFALHGGRLNATLDLRDAALTPRRGLLLQASGEVTGALYTKDVSGNPVTVNFAKLSALATGYIPIGERFVLALSVRGGRILPLVAGSTTPPVRRFFLGGATSVRGFNEDQLIAEDVRAQYRDQVKNCTVLITKAGCSSAAKTILDGRQVPSQGGELFALFKAEVRFPAFSVFDFGVFFEAGNLWLALPQALSLRPVVGAGLRYVTPIGPLALDVAVNLVPDQFINEPPVVVHFNIGLF